MCISLCFSRCFMLAQLCPMLICVLRAAQEVLVQASKTSCTRVRRHHEPVDQHLV